MGSCRHCARPRSETHLLACDTLSLAQFVRTLPRHGECGGVLPGTFRQPGCPPMACLAEGPWHSASDALALGEFPRAGRGKPTETTRITSNVLHRTRRSLEVTFDDAPSADRACHPPPRRRPQQSVVARWGRCRHLTPHGIAAAAALHTESRVACVSGLGGVRDAASEAESVSSVRAF